MRLTLALAALFAVTLGTRADDKPTPTKDWPYTGTWTKTGAEGVELTFSFRSKTEFVLTAVVADSQLKATCQYTLDKDKKVRAVVTKTEVKGDFPQTLEKGFEMTFKLDVAKGGATTKLSDYEADNADHVREIVEGTYKAKKAD